LRSYAACSGENARPARTRIIANRSAAAAPATWLRRKGSPLRAGCYTFLLRLIFSGGEAAIARTIPIDVEYLGFPRAIAACLLESDGVTALVDPGPSVTLPVLRKKLAAQGLSVGDLDMILLTHIHLDHAGATGTLVRENPKLRVWVHEFGAARIVDPTRLLQSARRLYGDAMDHLYGEVLPVPAENICALVGGEEIRIGSRKLGVLYTPGHASHHVSFLDAAEGTAFVGDSSGIRIENQGFVMPVTPPPDVDLPQWPRSIAGILERKPHRLFLTHFGYAERPEEHFAEFSRRIFRWSEEVRRGLEQQTDDDERMARFVEMASGELLAALPGEEGERYVKTGGLGLSWAGLARYWRKRVPALANSS
jgi:glyoxylase-like metal-dependent hydrolase (beta-lactamase superfamily II)